MRQKTHLLSNYKENDDAMKVIAFLFVIWFSCFTELESGEVVQLKNGQSKRGVIRSKTSEEVVFEFRKSNGQYVKIKIPWTSIDLIEFDPIPGELGFLNDPQNTSISSAASLWEKRYDWLPYKNSTAARVGILYAQKLSEKEGADHLERELEIFDKISQNAWSEEDRSAAFRQKLIVLLKMGKKKEAVKLAKSFADKQEDPSLLLEAKSILASEAFENLKALQEEHPRWYLDQEVIPQREQLYNESINLALYPFLFHGSKAEAASRGLYRAAEIYLFVENRLNASKCAGDILRYYPNTEYAESARQFFDILKQTQNENNQ